MIFRLEIFPCSVASSFNRVNTNTEEVLTVERGGVSGGFCARVSHHNGSETGFHIIALLPQSSQRDYGVCAAMLDFTPSIANSLYEVCFGVNLGGLPL